MTNEPAKLVGFSRVCAESAKNEDSISNRISLIELRTDVRRLDTNHDILDSRMDELSSQIDRQAEDGFYLANEIGWLKEEQSKQARRISVVERDVEALVEYDLERHHGLDDGVNWQVITVAICIPLAIVGMAVYAGLKWGWF